MVFLASVALCHAGGWGGVTIIGPAAKGAAYGAAGAVIAPARSAGVVTAAITPGAVLKTGPALFAAPIAYAAPAPVVAPIAYAAPAPAPVVLEPVPAIGKGESVITGPSGSVSAGPGGRALLVGPPGSAVPDYSAYAYGGGYGGYGGEGAWEGEGRWGGKGKW